MDQIPPEQLAALAQEDQGPLTKAVVIAFTIIAFISVCLRLFTRLRYQAVGWEDHTIAISMVMAIITAIFQVLQANAGIGKHAIFVPVPEGMAVALKLLFWSIIFYNLSLTFTKISILLQYSRIFALTGMRIPLYIVMGICVAWGITTLFNTIFLCVPVYAYWQVLEQANAKCLDSKTVWYAHASINIVTDLLVAILPVRVIWGLHIPKRQKIALLCVLTIGWFVCVVSILRLHTLVALAAHPDDRTYWIAATAYWSAIEMDLAIVCACLPALKPLLVKIMPRFLSTRHSEREHGTIGTNGMHRIQRSGSKSTRHTVEDLELDGAVSSKAYPSTPVDVAHGKNIYVSRQFEQHFEESGQNSDNESQKDLVATPNSAFEQH